MTTPTPLPLLAFRDGGMVPFSSLVVGDLFMTDGREDVFVKIRSHGEGAVLWINRQACESSGVLKANLTAKQARALMVQPIDCQFAADAREHVT